jgi:hypothetical protein
VREERDEIFLIWRDGIEMRERMPVGLIPYRLMGE